MRKFKIKIKTAQGTRFEMGIFPSKRAALDAGMDMLGETEGNVSATEVPA
jgi:hypothetical protein